MINEQWLIGSISIVDHIIINTKGLDSHWLLGLILSKSKTMYFAPDKVNQPFNMLNANRIYSFDSLNKIFQKGKDK